MKVEKLEVGQVVKNYKELCTLLEVEQKKSGNSRNAQIKEIERFIDYDKQGHKYIVKEIYNKPKESMDSRSVYSHIVQLLIMDLLSQNDGNIVITKERLTRKIGLTNDNYSLGYRHQDKMSEYLNVDNLILGDFYKVNTSSISKIIDTAIDSLQRKFILHKQDVMMIQYYNEDKARVATPFDRELVQTINKEVLVTLGISEQDIKTRNVNYFRFKELQNKLINQRTQIKSYYNAMDIVVNRTYIDSEIKEITYDIMTELERKGKIQELNNLYATKTIEKAENRHDKVISETDNKEELSDVLLSRFSEMYVTKFQKMTNQLIKINAPVIDKGNFFKGNYNMLSDDEIENINNVLPF